jgi:hypothetical protein
LQIQSILISSFSHLNFMEMIRHVNQLLHTNSLLSGLELYELKKLEAKNKTLPNLLSSCAKKHSFELKMANLFQYLTFSEDNIEARCFTVGFMNDKSGAILYNLKKL